MARSGRAIGLGVCAWLVFAAGLAEGQIPREQYLKYLPLTYPRLVRETVASQQFRLYGNPDDPAFRDSAPKDGVDDARAAWLQKLGVRFAPLMVRNSALFPMDPRSFFDRPSFAINVDTWDLAREKASLISGTRIGMAGLAAQPCPAPDSTEGDDCRLLSLVKEFGPRRGPLEPEVAGRAEQERFTVLYFDMPGYDAKSWHEQFWPPKDEVIRRDLTGSERVFVHPFVAEAATGEAGGQGYELVLQYWFFFPVNDGPNDHEGDWEHINVIVSPRSKVEQPLAAADLSALLSAMRAPEGDDPLVIRRIEYYFHHFVYPMDFASPNAYQPRASWDREVRALAKDQHGGRWLWDRIRERAWQDEAETTINTRPVIWIGGDAIGIQSVLEMPGLKDRDGHASYPFRGYYKHIGPGVGERVIRGFDFRKFLAQPGAGPDYVEDFGTPAKVALLPDWERVTDPVLTDAEARRNWAWLLLPVRFGYPASPSPGAGVVSHVDTGNASVTGPAFNGGWNRIGASSGYDLYEMVKSSWATPLGATDSFFPRAGFLNAPILYFMVKPPLDLVWRTLALPVRAAVGSRQPTFRPAGAPPRRQVSLEAGAMITPVSEDFTALFYNREQYQEIVLRVALALPPGAADSLTTVARFPTIAAPAYSIVFDLGRRFSTESSLTSYSALVGLDVLATGTTAPVEVRGQLEQFDYHGNLRFNLLTGSVRPYVKYGSGITWYQLKNVSVAGQLLTDPTSPKFKPSGSWKNLGFNELILGGGLDMNPVKAGKMWLGLKVSYTAIHHALGFEQEADVESSPTLARLLAGTTYSVWRHQLRLMGTVGF